MDGWWMDLSGSGQRPALGSSKHSNEQSVP